MAKTRRRHATAFRILEIRISDLFRISCFLTVLLVTSSTGAADDWQLRWSRELPARKPAWEFTQRMGQDTGYSPVAAGGMVFVGCEHNGAILALDGTTGKEALVVLHRGPDPPLTGSQRHACLCWLGRREFVLPGPFGKTRLESTRRPSRAASNRA